MLVKTWILFLFDKKKNVLLKQLEQGVSVNWLAMRFNVSNAAIFKGI